MDFDINKQMKEDEKAFGTLEQRNIIYKEHLMPLKAKISQILLYDVEVANALLQKYLSIEKNEDRSITEIMAHIADLEDEIQEYEDNKGKEELFREQSTVISTQLDDLKENSEEIDIKDFESRFSDIRELYNKNLENYSYKDRSVVETKISEVQAKLIIRRVRSGVLDLHKEISKDDIAGLTMVINNNIFNLMKNPNSDVQNIVNEIKYKMIDRTDIVYDPEIWGLLDSALTGKGKAEPRRVESETTKINTSNALVPIMPKKHKGFALPNLGELFGRNVIKIGDQRMKVATTVQIGDMTVNVKDLSGIDLYWLAEHVSQQMLIDIEDKQLRKEGKGTIKQKYMPDSKTPIYDEFEKIGKLYHDDEYVFYNESGTKLYYRYSHRVGYEYNKCLENENQDYIEGSSEKFEPIDKNFNIINYAKLIDKLTNGDLQQQLLNELGVCIEKQILRNDKGKAGYIMMDEREKIIRKLPILRNLSKSYNRVMQQIEETKMDFGGQEKAKRDEFYQKNQFKDDLKVSGEQESLFGQGLLEEWELGNQGKSNEENGDGTGYRGY